MKNDIRMFENTVYFLSPTKEECFIKILSHFNINDLYQLNKKDIQNFINIYIKYTFDFDDCNFNVIFIRSLLL